MLILRTNPAHRLYVNFLLEDGEICIQTKLEPTMTARHYYRSESIVLKRYISDEGPFTSDQYILPMLMLLKELLPEKVYNTDAWIEKCKAQKYHYNAYERGDKDVTRGCRLANYGYILYDNKLASDVVDKINIKIEKIKTAIRVKNLVEEYNKFSELKEKFGCEQ